MHLYISPFYMSHIFKCVTPERLILFIGEVNVVDTLYVLLNFDLTFVSVSGEQLKT